MNKAQPFEWMESRRRLVFLFAAPVLACMVGGVYVLVYMTGGIKYVYSHSMYIPILLSGFVFGVKGGALAGLAGGIILGPFMPIDVTTGEMQKTINWLYRTGFFTLIGCLAGAGSDSATAYISRLRWLSRHDASTGLPNRAALFDKLSGPGGKKRAHSPCALAVVSFENAMELKSTFGFGVIEEAVRQMAERLEKNHAGTQAFRTSTAQIGLLINGTGEEDWDRRFDECLEASRDPTHYNGISIHLDTRMGTVVVGRSGETPEDSLQHAEAALAVAREKSLDRAAYGPEIMEVTRKNLLILGGLKDAIREGQLSLHYQPKIRIQSGAVHGVESLMRWHHPEQGDIPSGLFVPRAEQSTLIHMITQFALQEAIRQMAGWREMGIHIPAAVNISVRNLLQPGFTDTIAGLLERYGIKGEQLELEITEGALMTDMTRTIDKLARLAELNIVISIDDFGTGYSSLQYLHRLPISQVKIDQSFIRRLPDDRGAAHIVEASVMLAHKMGIRAIAEGVEKPETLEFLKTIGCDMAQGYMISPPLTADDFARWYLGAGGHFPPT